MKIEDSRSAHYANCKNLTEFTNVSNYMGLGLLWLLYSNNNKEYFFCFLTENKVILIAVILFVFSILFHLIGTLWLCIYWHFEFRSREVCFYKDISPEKVSVGLKLKYWLCSIISPIEIRKSEKEIKDFEEKEYHVKDNVNTLPYIFFYTKILLSFLGYVFILISFFTSRVM